MPRRLLAPATLLVLCACAGEIGAPVSPTATPDSVRPDGGSEGGGSGGAGANRCEAPDPGRVTLRRLNRFEYDNTVRDLLGDQSRPAQNFLADDYGYGFDTIADVLTLAPAQLEKYEGAARQLVDAALFVETRQPVERVFEAEDPAVEKSLGAETDGGWNLWSNGSAIAPVIIEVAGTYRIRVRAYGTQAGPDPARMAVLLGGRVLQTIDVPNASAQLFELTAELSEGPTTLGVEFTNDFYDEVAGLDRNLIVDWFELTGPIGWTGGAVSPRRAELLFCDLAAEGEACARRVLERFASRAFRRPVEAGELDRLVSLSRLATAEGDPLETGVRLALTAVLLSPQFLYRPELDPDPTSPAPRPLTPYELASRLSYFVWSSTPDAELLAAAADGSLVGDAALERQVRRMLEDPKSEAFIESFAGQWLHARKLDDVTRNAEIFPEWSPALAASMRAESFAFFRSFLREQKPARELLTADYAFVDDTLAAHYGLPLPGSATPVKVSTATTTRRGLLGTGTLLTVTSNSTRTSLVKRGKWVLSELLCSTPADPPPNVEAFPEEPDPTATLRERLELHRAKPECAACHDAMDPIGFGLEGFDAIGRARTREGAFPVDDAGVMPDGTAFRGAAELSGLIAADPRLSQCIVERMLVYGLGRGVSDPGAREPRASDACHLDAIGAAWTAKGERMSDLVVLIAQSEPFRTRRGEPEVQP